MDNLQIKIEKLHNAKDYRPVVVVVVKKGNKFLMVQSAKGNNSWILPQGGIDYGETPEIALFREIEEEVAIKKRELKIIKPLFYFDTKDAPKKREDKRGFNKGKAYFFSLCEYNGKDLLTLQEEEVKDYKWVTITGLQELLKTARKEKREMTIKALKKIDLI